MQLFIALLTNESISIIRGVMKFYIITAVKLRSLFSREEEV